MEIPVNILAGNKTLLGILNIPDHQHKRPIVVIMCYGFNGDRVEQHRMSVTMGRLFAQHGVNFCRFDFRNQGVSDGSFDDFVFSEKQEDINSIINYMQACFRRNDLLIYIIGFSNGCKVAIDVGCDNGNVNGIVLWNPILQELAEKGEDAGDSRRLYRHPVTRKPYKKFYSLRLNTKLLYELNTDQSMTKLKTIDKPIFCILSRDDISVRPFCKEIEKLYNNADLDVEYIENTDHLFGSVEKVRYVINSTLKWILKKAET